MANITGWGRGAWGEGAWNAPLPVEVTGVAGTTALGSESVLPSITVAVTGVAGTTGSARVPSLCDAVERMNRPLVTMHD